MKFIVPNNFSHLFFLICLFLVTMLLTIFHISPGLVPICYFLHPHFFNSSNDCRFYKQTGLLNLHGIIQEFRLSRKGEIQTVKSDYVLLCAQRGE
jgi:hypothetical protein